MQENRTDCATNTKDTKCTTIVKPVKHKTVKHNTSRRVSNKRETMWNTRLFDFGTI